MAKCDSCFRIGGADEMVALSRSLGKQVYFTYAEILGCTSALFVRALQPHACNPPDLALGRGHGASPCMVVCIIDVNQARRE